MVWFPIVLTREHTQRGWKEGGKSLVGNFVALSFLSFLRCVFLFSCQNKVYYFNKSLEINRHFADRTTEGAGHTEKEKPFIPVCQNNKCFFSLYRR